MISKWIGTGVGVSRSACRFVISLSHITVVMYNVTQKMVT
jgi:hypothetical protein